MMSGMVRAGGAYGNATMTSSRRRRRTACASRARLCSSTRRRRAVPVDAVSAFLFQDEDGIRAIGVTGVQTCALPIYLQQALRETVAADGDADEEEVFAALHQLGVHGEDGKDEEQSKHAQAVDAGEARAGAQFGCAHAIGMHREMRRESEARYSSKFRFFTRLLLTATWTRFASAARPRTTRSIF